MSPIETLLLLLGGNAMLLAALAFVAKSLLSQFLAKDIKKFESELMHRSQITESELRHRLDLATLEHQIKFSKLHDRQAKVIEDIYASMIDFEDATDILELVSDSTPGDAKENALRGAQDSGSRLAQYIRRNEIFLSEGTSKQLNEMISRVNPLLTGCSFNLIDSVYISAQKTSLYPEHKDAWRAVHEFITKEAPSIRKSLQAELRKCLGAKTEHHQNGAN